MLIADLEALLAKATPGNWEWHGGLLAVDNEHIIWPRNAREFGDTTPAQQIGACGERAEDDAEYNKALIAASHNALPAILTALRGLEWIRDVACGEVQLDVDGDSEALGQIYLKAKALLAALSEGPQTVGNTYTVEICGTCGKQRESAWITTANPCRCNLGEGPREGKS